MSELERGLAKLRHLYAQMVTGLVRPSEHDIANAARGLLAPAITYIEQAQRRICGAEITSSCPSCGQSWKVNTATGETQQLPSREDSNETRG